MNWSRYYNVYHLLEYQGTVNNYVDLMDLCFGRANPPPHWSFTVSKDCIYVSARCNNNGQYDLDISGGKPVMPWIELD